MWSKQIAPKVNFEILCTGEIIIAMNEASKQRESTSPNIKYFSNEFDIHCIHKNTEHIVPLASPLPTNKHMVIYESSI